MRSDFTERGARTWRYSESFRRHRIHVLVVAVTVAAAWLLAANVWISPTDSSSTAWTGLLAFAALAILCDSSFLRLSFANVGSSVAFVPLIASVILFQHPWPMLISGATAAVVETFVRKKPPIRIWFNIAQYMVAVGLGAEAYRSLGGTVLSSQSFSFNAFAFVALVLTYFLVNSGSVALAVAISSGVSVRKAWIGIIAGSLLFDLFASSLAVLLAFFYVKSALLGLALMVVPLYFVRDMYQMKLQLERFLPSSSRREGPLADRYTIEREVGRGGMATVYLGHDLKHRRSVAIKVLRPELAAALGAERFLREIEILAGLRHPHLLTLIDSGSDGRFVYYVMPYVDGESLRARLVRDRQLPVDAVLQITTQIADALHYCHGCGVLHRDIKPENILLSGGHAIVADFGIAKAISTAGRQNVTGKGVGIGTPGYMSPEQAAGLSDLDERSDVYSLAVVCYEMLVGAIPRFLPTEDPARPGRFLGLAPSHRSRLNEVGGQIEAALVHGLALRYDQRTPTPAALVAELTLEATPGRRYGEGELQEIAKPGAEAAGTPPDQLRAPAASLEVSAAAAGAGTWHSRWLGGPRTLRFERLVEGEIPESDYQVMVDEIRRVVKNTGQVSQLGQSFLWAPKRSWPSGRDLEVAVSVRGGRTFITLRENLLPLIAPITGVGAGLGIGGLGAIVGMFGGALQASWALGWGVPLSWLGTTVAATRTAYGYIAKRRAREVGELADRLAVLARKLVPERPALQSPHRP